MFKQAEEKSARPKQSNLDRRPTGPRDADKAKAKLNPSLFGETFPGSFDVIRVEYLFVFIPGMNLLNDFVSVNVPFVRGT